MNTLTDHCTSKQRDVIARRIIATMDILFWLWEIYRNLIHRLMRNCGNEQIKMVIIG